MIYSPGQAKVLFDVWPEQAEYFIVGGPANGNEAQTVKRWNTKTMPGMAEIIYRRLD